MFSTVDEGSRTYRDGQIILPQNHIGEAMGLVEKGRVEVFHKTEDGEETVHQVLEANGVFGIDSLFNNQPRRSGVRALGEARIALMDRREFIRRSQNTPMLAFTVLRSICRRLREATEELETNCSVDEGRQPTP